MWNNLGLSSCSKLRSVTLSYEVQAESVYELLFAQVVLHTVMEQLPPSVQTLRLCFQTRATRVTSAFTLLSPHQWAQLIRECRAVEQLSHIDVSIGLQGGGLWGTAKDKANVLSDLIEICTEGTGMCLRSAVFLFLMRLLGKTLSVGVTWNHRRPDTTPIDD